MIPESHASINADHILDVALHHEIKCRAYELYEWRHDTVDGHDLKDKLQAELPRVAYAAAQLQKYANGEVGDTRAVRAARVYLRALSSFIGEVTCIEQATLVTDTTISGPGESGSRITMRRAPAMATDAASPTRVSAPL